MLKFLLDRLREPSSWATVVAFLALVGVPQSVADTVGQIGLQIIGVLAAILGFLLPESRGSKDSA